MCHSRLEIPIVLSSTSVKMSVHPTLILVFAHHYDHQYRINYSKDEPHWINGINFIYNSDELVVEPELFSCKIF